MISSIGGNGFKDAIERALAAVASILWYFPLKKEMFTPFPSFFIPQFCYHLNLKQK
jgi:hypothetical protein